MFYKPPAITTTAPAVSSSSWRSLRRTKRSFHSVAVKNLSQSTTSFLSSHLNYAQHSCKNTLSSAFPQRTASTAPSPPAPRSSDHQKASAGQASCVLIADARRACVASRLRISARTASSMRVRCNSGCWRRGKDGRCARAAASSWSARRAAVR